MAERLKAPVLKTGSGGNLARGFESLPRRLVGHLFPGNEGEAAQLVDAYLDRFAKTTTS